MSEDISVKNFKISEYLFLIDKIEDVKMIDSAEYFKRGYGMLDKIREGEDYLFFHMKDSIKSEIKYYSKNIEELYEVIEILDKDYAISSYHHILRSMIDTKYYLKRGDILEFCLLETKEEISDDKIGDVTGIFALPEGTLKELTSMKNESKKTNNESLYL